MPPLGLLGGRAGLAGSVGTADGGPLGGGATAVTDRWPALVESPLPWQAGKRPRAMAKRERTKGEDKASRGRMQDKVRRTPVGVKPQVQGLRFLVRSIQVIAKPRPDRLEGSDVIADDLGRRRNRHRQDQPDSTPQHTPQQQR